jgi:hypothetical protein
MTSTRWLRSSLIVFLGFVAFSPILHLGFQLDDHVTIESNPAIRRWDRQALKEDFFPNREDSQNIYYRPMQSFMNRLQYTLWKLHPAGYHLTNLLLHIANAILVAELLVQLSWPSWTALAAGSLFAVHPIIVSELLMVSGIPEIMSFFFSLAALLLLLQKKSAAVCLGMISYGLALLSKESAFAVPLYFLLLCWARRTRDGVLQRMLGLLIITSAYVLLRAWGLGSTGLYGLDFPIQTSLLFLIGRFPSILLRYVGLILFPWHLHSYRLIPEMNPFWAYGAGLLLCAAYSAGKKPVWTLFCVLWFVLSFVPKIPLMVTGHYMLEHWAYPGLLAVLLPISVALTKGWHSPEPIRQKSATGLFIVMLCGCIFSAQFHAAMRATDERNYRWSLRFTRASPLLFNLGLICLRTGRAAEAVTYIEPVQALYPDDENIRSALATAYARSGRTAEPRRSSH